MRNNTIIILLVNLILLVIWDVYVYLRNDIEATISKIIYDFSRYGFVGILFTFCLGLLVGHFVVDSKRIDILITLLLGIINGALVFPNKSSKKSK